MQLLVLLAFLGLVLGVGADFDLVVHQAPVDIAADSPTARRWLGARACVGQSSGELIVSG